jgi:thiamine-phosphate pyrophosphorylase
VSCVQYREKKKKFDAMVKEATELKTLCHQYEVPLFINDHVELAKAIEADGLHLGQDDVAFEEARAVLPAMPIGISAKTVDEAKKAQDQGAVYLGVGALFETGSKSDATVINHAVVPRIKESVNIPVLLIGGISLETAKTLTVPYDGLCAISAILSAKNPERIAQELKTLIT